MVLAQQVVLAGVAVALGLALFLIRQVLQRAGRAAWVPSDAEAADFEAMQGTWDLVAMRREGAAVDVEGVKSSCYVFRGNSLRVTGVQTVCVWSFELDGRHEPKKLALFCGCNEHGEFITDEIAYELAGNEMRWCTLANMCPNQLLPDDTPVGTVRWLRKR